MSTSLKSSVVHDWPLFRLWLLPQRNDPLGCFSLFFTHWERGYIYQCVNIKPANNYSNTTIMASTNNTRYTVVDISFTRYPSQCSLLLHSGAHSAETCQPERRCTWGQDPPDQHSALCRGGERKDGGRKRRVGGWEGERVGGWDKEWGGGGGGEKWTITLLSVPRTLLHVQYYS